MLADYTEIQIKVRGMTNNDAWGISPSDMHNLCIELNYEDSRDEILVAIRERLYNDDSTWRNIYKAMTLYEYFLLHGSAEYLDFILNEGKRQDVPIFEDLVKFEHVDSSGKDQGINVRTRALAILKLLKNSTELQTARESASENRKIMLMRKANIRQMNNDHLYKEQKSSNDDDGGEEWGEMTSAKQITNEAIPVKNVDLDDRLGELDGFDEFDEFQSPTPKTTNEKETNKDDEIQTENEAKRSEDNNPNSLSGFLSSHSNLINL